MKLRLHFASEQLLAHHTSHRQKARENLAWYLDAEWIGSDLEPGKYPRHTGKVSKFLTVKFSDASALTVMH